MLTVDYDRLGRGTRRAAARPRVRRRPPRLPGGAAAGPGWWPSTPMTTRSRRCATPSAPCSTPARSSPTTRPGRSKATPCASRSPTAASTASSPPRCWSTSPTTTAAMAELSRVLRPGGTMAVTVPRFGPEVGQLGAVERVPRRPRRPRPHLPALHLGVTPAAGRAAPGGQPPRPRPALAVLVAARAGWGRGATTTPRCGPITGCSSGTSRSAPPVTRVTERVLNPLLGKSLVVYLEKPA